ncbi:MAG: hypothetical protein K2X39_03805, partial [Silvanigrellaceae bacterium]|nr:hypothetical protein [Silvanigrellaceae bacterium]
MTSFDDFLKHLGTYRHHALLLISKSFAREGMGLEKIQKIAMSLCGISFEVLKQEDGGFSHHPDLFIADRERKILRLEEIEPIRERAQFAPVLAKKRLFFIDRCERMNVNAANSFLKVLEEPHLDAKVQFVLTTAFAQRVLPTVRSRCF